MVRVFRVSSNLLYGPEFWFTPASPVIHWMLKVPFGGRLDATKGSVVASRAGRPALRDGDGGERQFAATMRGRSELNFRSDSLDLMARLGRIRQHKSIPKLMARSV